jgi:MYXO-CTERM domain-containing protein
MKRPRKQKKSSPQILSFNQRLSGYALAAGAAGIGLFAAPHAAEAEIVFTPTNITLTNGHLDIDLNHDGIVDFAINNSSAGGICCIYKRHLQVYGGFVGSTQNAIVGRALNATALEPGAVIGSKQLFEAAPLALAAAYNDSNSFLYVLGEFANRTDRFLGLEFTLDGKIHYAWARFQVVRAGFRGNLPIISATLTGYAYETVANQPIVAGQTKDDTVGKNAAPDTAPHPAALGLLALGAPALAIWRRREGQLN